MGSLKQQLMSAFTILGGGTSIFCAHAIYTGNERFYREIVMPSCSAVLSPETAHRFAVWAAARGFTPRNATFATTENPLLATRVFGLNFRHPIGLAAGFDKNADAPKGLLHDFGFSHVEVGSVTPLPQPGNEKPRVFRLPADQAVINRYGFNSEGQDAVAEKLEKLRSEKVNGIVGVNVGKNKTTINAEEDYVACITRLGSYADYLVVNISSPNTPGLRQLQKREQLAQLVRKVIAARNSLPNRPPLLVKIAPDLTDDELKDVCTVVMQPDCRVDGLVVSNTTVSRSTDLASDPELLKETGGLSGAPLRVKSTELIRKTYQLTAGALPIVGVGGVASGEDALEKMRAGASLVQLYTALAYHGPPLVERVCREMDEHLRTKGITNVRAIVGSDHNKNKSRTS